MKMEGARPLSKTIMSAIVSSVLAVAAVILLILLSFVLFLLMDSSVFEGFPVRLYSLYLIVAIAGSAVLLIVSLIFLFKNLGSISLETAGSFADGIGKEYARGRADDEILKYLDQGEREIYSILVDSGGSVLQRDIVSLRGYSKATVTRILNRLEAKGLIERMRHGSTNRIVLKRSLK